jgi:hypothetical protein
VNRRSFLSAILGAAAAPVAAKLVPVIAHSDACNAEALRQFGDTLRRADCVRPFMVWDSVVMRPGEVISDQIFPPPCPLDFVINAIGVSAAAETRADSLNAAMQVARFEIDEKGLTCIDTPLYFLAFNSFTRLPLPLKFQKPETSSIYIHTGDQKCENTEPVTLTVMFSGLARA